MNNNNPLFSVVIPTYNHGHFIKRCLSSVIMQSYTNWEVIVVNNFSQDNTIELVESFNDPRIRLINIHNNGVIAVSRNKGIAEARGEWICFLDSDDWWFKNKLQECKEYIGFSNFIYHSLLGWSENGKIAKNKYQGRELKNKKFIDVIVNGNAISNSSVVVKKQLLEDVNFLNENKHIVSAEDLDLWIKLLIKDNNAKYISKPLGAYWVGNNNISSSNKILKADYYVITNYFSELSSALKKRALANYSYRAGLFYFSSRNYKIAVKYFIKSIKNNSFKIKLKSLFYILLSLLKRKES